MELDKKDKNKVVLRFRIICNFSGHLEAVIEWYNRNYKTDFKLVEVIHDEVNFTDIEVSHYQPSDLFNLGYQFGVKEQKLRERGEIDW